MENKKEEKEEKEEIKERKEKPQDRVLVKYFFFLVCVTESRQFSL
jgi:hypothetical protein